VTVALTDPAARAARRGWTDVIPLLAVTFYRDRFGAGPASVTVYLSDRAVRIPTTGIPTTQYLPYVLDWGSLGDALNPLDAQVSIGAFAIRVANDRPVPGAARLSALFRYGTHDSGYDPALSTAVLRLWFRGTDPAVDVVQVWRLTVQEPDAITPESLMLNLASVELEIEDRSQLLRVTNDRFPLAAPSAIGQRIPLLLGTVRRVPALFVKAGLIDRLRAEITATTPGPGGWLPLSTPDLIARWTVPGVVQIDKEQILIDARNGPDAQLRVAPNGRGTNGTLAAVHGFGVEVTQGLDEYVGIFGQNVGAYGAAELTGIYADLVFKNANAKPVHVINLADTLSDLAPDWAALGYTFVTVRFAAAFDNGGAGAVVWNEIKEFSIRGGCWGGGLGFGGPGFGLAGHSVVRCGIDAPCGTAWDYYRNGFRWNLSALAGSQGSVKLRFSPLNGLTGAFGQPGTAPTGPLEETFASQPHNTGYRNLRVDVVDWDAPLAPGAEAASVLQSFTPIDNGRQQDVFGYIVEVDLTTIFNTAKADGRTNLVVLLRVNDESSPPRGWVNNWWPILAETIWTPTLFLGGVTADDGALIRRPAGGQSGSAAEAALGVVTADVVGLSGAIPWAQTEPDIITGTAFAGNKNSLTTTISLGLDPLVNYLLVIVHEYALTTFAEAFVKYVSGITYNGVSLTELGSTIHTEDAGGGHFTSIRTYVYGLAAPATGGAHNVVVNRIALFGDGGFKGVVETVPLRHAGAVGAVATASGVTPTGSFFSLTTPITAGGGILFDFLTAGLVSSLTEDPHLGHPAAQVQRYRVQNPDLIGGEEIGDNYNMAIASSSKRALGGAAMAWTDATAVQQAAGCFHGHVIVEILPP
jgi:hypothetical protein